MTSLSPVALSLLGVLAVLLVAAAFTDVRRRDIANSLTLAIAFLAVPWWFAAGLSGSAMLWQLGAATLLFALFAGCFFVGLMGGGDVKLIAALALWLPLGALADLLVWMALAGGALTIVMMVRHRLARAEGVVEVPYGVAIVGSALLVLANDILTTAVA